MPESVKFPVSSTSQESVVVTLFVILPFTLNEVAEIEGVPAKTTGPVKVILAAPAIPVTGILLELVMLRSGLSVTDVIFIPAMLVESIVVFPATAIEAKSSEVA